MRIKDIDATLKELLDILQHDDDVKKDDAVLHATANALYLKLGILLHLNGAEGPIEKMCRALNMVYENACYGARERSIKAIGGELISLLVLVIERCKDGTLYDENRDITASAFDVLLNISIAPSAKVPLASKGNFIHVMLDEVNREAVCSCTNSDTSKATTLAILSKILSRTDARKILMQQYPDLVNMLLDSLILSAQHSNPEVRYRSAQNIFQLPYFDDANSNMVQRSDLLSVLVELMDDSCGKTRKYAAGTFCQMSFRMSSDASRIMAQHDDGAALAALISVGGKDKNFDARKYALQTLQNLICEDTVHCMAGHPGMVVSLAKIGIDDALRDVRALAIDALSKLTVEQQARKEAEEREVQEEREAQEQAEHQAQEAAALEAQEQAEQQQAISFAVQSEDREEEEEQISRNNRNSSSRWNFMTLFCPTDMNIFPSSSNKNKNDRGEDRDSAPPHSVTVTRASDGTSATHHISSAHTVESSSSPDESEEGPIDVPSVVQSASMSSAMNNSPYKAAMKRKAKSCVVCKGRSCEICQGEGSGGTMSQAGQ